MMEGRNSRHTTFAKCSRGDEIRTILATDCVRLYMPVAGSHHCEMGVSRRTLLILCVVAVAAFVVTLIAAHRPQEARTIKPEPATAPAPDALRMSDPRLSAVAAPMWRSNPAAQKAGPPDANADRSSATSAEDAARAAAQLAQAQSQSN